MSGDPQALRAMLLERLRTGAVRLGGSRRIARLPDEAPRPLSRAQQRIVFAEALYPQACFNSSLILRKVGDLDLDHLSDCLRALIDKHEVLRTLPAPWLAGPVGRLVTGVKPACDAFDVQGLPPTDRRLEALRIARRVANRRFEIFTEAPLLRAAVIHTAPDESLLVLVMHAFICDATSAGLLANELVEAYATQPRGGVRLQPAAFQYADHVAATAVDAAATPRDLDYWVRELAGSAPELILPTARAREARPSLEAIRLPFTIAAEDATRLRRLGRETGATFYMTLLTALKVMMARHTNQPSVPVGAWMIRRTPENAELIGPFVNTLVYRTAIDPGHTLREALTAVRAQALGAYAHADAPFEDVVAAINPPRSAAVNPIFQVHFILQDTRGGGDRHGFSLSELDGHVGASGGYDMELIVRDLPRGVEGYLECSAELFDVAGVRQIRDRLLTVVEAMASDATQRVGAIDFGAAQPQAGPAAAAVSLESVLARIGEGPDEAPCAVVDGRRFSRADLRSAANAFEAWMSAAGPDALVVIGCGPGLPLYAAIVAALRSGVAFVSLGPGGDAAVTQRLARRFPRLLAIVDGPGGAAPPGLPAGTVARSLDDLPASGPLPLRQHSADACAYLSLSSGSTGEPAITRIPRAALASHVASLRERLALDDTSVVLQATHPRFDVLLEEVLPTLAAGGCLVAAGSGVAGVADLQRLMTDQRVTVANLSPSVCETWLDDLEVRGGAHRPPDLEALVLGSEPVSIELVRRARCLLGPGVRLFNAYGVAQATVTSSLHEFDAGTDRLVRAPIGRPLPGTRLGVFDIEGRPLQDLLVGEIWIGGGGVGIDHDADASHRFVTRPDGVWFRTGDLGRRLPCGDFEYLGRRAAQHKVRGRFVDLASLEAAMAGTTGVAACHVTLEGQGAATRIVARVWTPSAERGRPTADLRARIAAALGPLGGGVDRIDVVGERPSDGDDETVPSPVLRDLRACLQEVTGWAVIPYDGDLFELGLTSLDVVRFLARAAARGLQVSLADLYDHPRLRELARRTSTTLAHAEAAAVSPAGAPPTPG